MGKLRAYNIVNNRLVRTFADNLNLFRDFYFNNIPRDIVMRFYRIGTAHAFLSQLKQVEDKYPQLKESREDYFNSDFAAERTLYMLETINESYTAFMKLPPKKFRDIKFKELDTDYIPAGCITLQNKARNVLDLNQPSKINNYPIAQKEVITKAKALQITEVPHTEEETALLEDLTVDIEEYDQRLIERLRGVLNDLINIPSHQILSMKPADRLRNTNEIIKAIRLLQGKSTENKQTLSIVKAIGIATTRRTPTK